MKAIAVEAFGDPENLTLVERPTPNVGAGQVLIAVEAAGVGLADALARRHGGGHQPGFVPGVEVAGTVVAVGEGVDKARLNSRVFTMVEEGGYAESLAVDAGLLAPIPPTIPSAEAVALGVNAMVASCSLRRARLTTGERVLVRGAGGGIGVMATQLAALGGATVTVTTSSSDRGQRLQHLGASQVLDRAGNASGQPPEGFDIIIDTVAGPDTRSFLGRLNKNGRMVMCGIAGGFPERDFGMELFRNLRSSLTISFLSLQSIDTAGRQAAIEEIFALAAAGSLKAVIHEILPLESAATAHAKLESGGEVFGKIVLAPAAS